MPKYWWWFGKDLAPFFALVAELGSDNVQIQFDPETQLLSVIPGDAEKGGPTTFNFSHGCPPDCGGG